MLVVGYHKLMEQWMEKGTNFSLKLLLKNQMLKELLNGVLLLTINQKDLIIIIVKNALNISQIVYLLIMILTFYI